MAKRIKRWAIMIVFTIALIAVGATIGAQELRVHSEVESGFEIPTEELQKEDGIAILSYHRILKDQVSLRVARSMSNNNQLSEYNITKDNFIAQIEAIEASGAEIISMDQAHDIMAADIKPVGKYVVLTFDDIAESAFQNAYPYLKANKIPFTAFIITSKVGKYDADQKLASWAQLKEMHDSGLATIALHTNDMHYLKNDIPVGNLKSYEDFFQEDYEASQATYLRHFGEYAHYFASPYGTITKNNVSFLNHQTEMYGVFNLSQRIIETTTPHKGTLDRILITNKNWNQFQAWLDYK
ncbi:polysaccharide deacetylase family protein [Lacticaseibacillus kribbianus]|uniref:polysaccharide deacetylase family protein n=1 Tax=Lacticaseibacillus kribbianus TaxID=2926292 RepID=UPI001CD6E844|nr:polysaccharide deacetylase family protein [Lacticaseibacillus kribbianus]